MGHGLLLTTCQSAQCATVLGEARCEHGIELGRNPIQRVQTTCSAKSQALLLQNARVIVFFGVEQHHHIFHADSQRGHEIRQSHGVAPTLPTPTSTGMGPHSRQQTITKAHCKAKRNTTKGTTSTTATKLAQNTDTETRQQRIVCCTPRAVEATESIRIRPKSTKQAASCLPARPPTNHQQTNSRASERARKQTNKPLLPSPLSCCSASTGTAALSCQAWAQSLRHTPQPP